MKITGTKKLFIILFALVCALAAGLGVVIAKSGAPSHTAAATSVDSVADATQNDMAVDEENIDEEQLVEKEYDERFDEGVIRDIANLFELDFEVVNFYCHAKNIDPREIMDVLWADLAHIEEKNANIVNIDYNRDRDGVLTQEEADAQTEAMMSNMGGDLVGSDIREDMALFVESYLKGEIEVPETDENEGWFVSPDDMSSYAANVYNVWQFINYLDGNPNYGIYGGILTFSKENLNATSAGDQWTSITAEIIDDNNLHIPSTYDHTVTVTGASARSQYGRYEYRLDYNGANYYVAKNLYGGTTVMTYGDHNFGCGANQLCGFHYKVELEPGQRFLISYYNYSDSYASTAWNGASWQGGAIGSPNAPEHWESTSQWYAGAHNNYGMWSYAYIDGDAPTGSIFYFVRGVTNPPYDYNSWTKRRTSWYLGAGSSYTASYEDGNCLNQSSQYWTYWIEIVRKDPPKPVLEEHDASDATKKTAYYEGEPVTLSIYPDNGAYTLNWSAWTNSSCTLPDTTVELISRSKHGVEPTVNNGFKAASLVVGSSAEGTHYVQLTSPTGKWSDGTTTPVVFRLEIQRQFTRKPTMLRESGVLTNGTEKDVNYNGEEQTVTFVNADPNFVDYTAPGMEFESWEGTTLTLKQKEKGKYTITLFLKNPAGCSWADADGGGTAGAQFTFWIQEQLIDQPDIESYSEDATRNGKSITADYNGEAKTLTLSPAREEQLIIVAAGMTYEFTKEDRDSDGEDDYFAVTFSMVDSGTQTITIFPNSGYLWMNKTDTVLSFSITINAVPIDFPELAEKEFHKDSLENLGTMDASIAKNATKVTYTFNPAKDWYATIVIKNIPKSAIIYTTSMTEVSWLPEGVTEDGDYPDYQRTVLTLRASNANQYIVTFALSTINYTWKRAGDSIPQFILQIDRCQLEAPKIIDEGCDTTNHELDTSHFKIEDVTKTVYWNTEENLDQPLSHYDDRFFDLFVGGFTGGYAGLGINAGQITIRITKQSIETFDLAQNWPADNGSLDNSTANLRLWANKAGNYIIEITPTANYEWVNGTNDMITFKFVVSAIFHDTPDLFYQPEGSSSWALEGFGGETEYSGDVKNIRIGNDNDATKYYIESEMSWSLIRPENGQVWNTFDSDYPTGFRLAVETIGTDENGKPITVLQGWATVAGTYIIRLSLKDENSVWRDGTGVDMDYTFTIRRKSIGTPVIIEEECSGGDDLKAYVNQDFISAGYDGFEVTMAINVLYDVNIIRVNLDPVGNDDDPSLPGGKGIWLASWGADNLDRLYVRSLNVGTHIVQLYVFNPNYRWDNGDTSYEFSIVIHPAEVEDVSFYYGDGDDKVFIGKDNADYEKVFDPDVTHHITVTRSDNAFQNTDFETQFTFKVSYIQTSFEYVDYHYTKSSLVIDFYDANTYYIEIYLTPNYRWKTSDGLVGDSRRMEFIITPKIVSVPKIMDEGEKENGLSVASIDDYEHKKVITYDATVSRSLLIDLGSDFRAYKINENETSSFFNKDGTVSMTYDKKVRYTGKNAGSYFLALELTDTNNYTWVEGSVVIYELEILPRPIAVPDAYFALQDDVGSDANAAYLDVMNGVIGHKIEADGNGDYKAGEDYNGKLQYIYLFGYAIENSEVIITITPENPDNGSGTGQRNITASTVMKGHYVYAKLVNVYTVKVEFKLSDEFGTPNCFWSSEPMGVNTEPRIFLLEIGKLGIELPNIQGESLVFENDLMEYHTTYTGDKADKAITVEKALSSSPILFMAYGYEKSLTDILWHVGNTLDFSILGVALVDMDYKLTISLDTANEYWINPDDSTDLSDINDKIISIIIDKLGITAPKIFRESDGAVYDYDGDENAKMLKYNGSSWNNALKIEDIDFDRLNFGTVTANMTVPYRDSSDHLITGSTIADSGTYELIISLKDKRNLKWDGTDEDSENLIFKLVIDPKRIAKPELDISSCSYNMVDEYDDTSATDLIVTYYKDAGNIGKMQYIVIMNFVDDEEQMIYEFLGDIFEDPVGMVGPANVTLKFGAANVGEYKIKITPSKNIGWDDGTEDPIIFTLKINKKIYLSPVLDDLGDPDTVNGQTRTVTYILDTYQQLVIKGVDPDILMLHGTNSDSAATINDELVPVSVVPGVGGDTYTYEALNVGVYTVTFFLINYTNESLDYAPTADHITFTFIIVKFDLEVPVFDLDDSLLLEDETVNANTFTAVYDAERHGALILNVLDEQYVRYEPVDADYDKVTGTKADKFFYGDPVASTLPSDTVGSVFNIGGYTTKFAGKFANGTTTLGDLLERSNFILVHAVEPGTYELIFSITDTVNMQWVGGSIDSVTLRIVMKKKQIPAPTYSTTDEQTKPYTGNPITFEIDNVYGISNAEKYVDSAEVVVAKGFDYELFQVTNVVSNMGTNATIVASKYNVDTHVLTLTATEIGDYTVTIAIIDTNFTEWTNSSVVTKSFTFHITKRGLSPEIKFVNPLLDDGTTDSTTQADFDNDNFVWPKSTTVSAQITFPNITLNAAGCIVMDNSFVFEVYYVNSQYPNVKLCDTFVMPSNAADLFSPYTAPIVATVKYSSDDTAWSLVVRNTADGLVYDLVYTFEMTVDSSSDYEFIPMGNYTLHAVQYGNSNTYTMGSTERDFEVIADRAPFETEGIYDYIVWEVYKVSDPDTVIDTYALSDIFPSDPTKHWSDMTEDDAIKLDFLEDNDSYGFRFTLDSSKMNSHTNVREALQSWEVDWNGKYGGKDVAKYAGPGYVSVKITAKDPNAFSFADTTYTFYYYINKMLYDLDGLEWDYDEVANPTDNPFTFDTKSHEVKLVGTFPEGLSVASYEVDGYDRNSQIYVGTYTTSVKFTTSNPNYEVPVFGDTSTYISTKFVWTVDWEIKKQTITPGWTDSIEAGETSTAAVPKLDEHGEKVKYTYYKKQSDGSWLEVDEFINTEYSYYKVYVELKTSDNPALDYASNYILEAQDCNVPTEPNVHYFQMDAGIFVDITIEIDGKAQTPGEATGVPAANVHSYTEGTVYEAALTINSPSWFDETNITIKYYSTTNTLKPIDPPTEPGHYLIKITLNAPDDGNEYVLKQTIYYFDIEKGTFDPGDVYWRYEHTDIDGNQIVAKYDEDNEIWQIISFIDKDGNDLTSSKGGMRPDFVYDGRTHSVFLYSEDENLVITMKNMAQINAGKFTEADGNAAIASFSYNGKLWNNPMEGDDPVTNLTVMEWEIEKAVIDLSELAWNEYDEFVYTISGGDEKKFSVSVDEDTIPDLLGSFVEYKTYNADDTDSLGNPKELSGNSFTKAGNYITEFIYSSILDDPDFERNYVLGDLDDDFDTKLEWTIKVREIEVPETNTEWQVFDGKEHELMKSIDMPENWQEYIKVSLQYAQVGSTTFAAYDGTEVFGNETSASHAGNYKYILSIIDGINTATQTNVVFTYFDGSDDVTTTDNQEATLAVAKATMTVDEWSEEAEFSTVTLSGTFVSYEFIDYKFRRKSDNSSVTVSEVAASSGEQFIITVYVKSEYENDVDLKAASGKSLEKEITSIAVSNAPENQTPVRRVPYIIGYIDGDLYESFTYDDWKKMMLADADFFVSLHPQDDMDNIDWFEYLGTEDGTGMSADDMVRVAEYKAQVRVSVTYTGNPVTFVVSEWNTGYKYSQYLTKWQGELTHDEAGDYSVIFMLQKNTLTPYCWDIVDEDGVLTVDRSVLELKMRVAFNMIPYPMILDTNYPTYSGFEIDILKYVMGDEAYDEWFTEYGKYFNIIGATATSAGSYTLRLEIKDIYFNTIHWDNGTAKGQPGTLTIKWKILPIYVYLPDFSGATITYDGVGHTIYELFVGYSENGLSEELQLLMQLAQPMGVEGTNAGSYTARFTLPAGNNYAWKTSMGAIDENREKSYPWAIQKKVLDMSNIKWNYDESDPFQYTIEYGEIQEHTLKLEGIPEELNEFISYYTDGVLGSTRSLMGKYHTVIYFFQNDIQYSNYSLENAPASFRDTYKDPAGVGYAAIDWEIVERRYNAPLDKEVVFDGTVRDLLALFGIDEGWENYLDVDVKYKPLYAGDDEYVSYFDMVENDAFLSYSPYNVFYLGDYYVEITIKSELNAETDCVVWLNGTIKETGTKSATLTIKPLEITIEGWEQDDNGNWIIKSEAYDKIVADNDECKDIFEYVIRDAATGEVVDMDYVRANAGVTFSVEFRIKDGNDYAVNGGIEIGCADGVTNPHIFCNEEFPSMNGNEQTDVLLWLPIPKLVEVVGSDDYDGTDKVYHIANWEDYYLVDSTFAQDMLDTYGVNIFSAISYLVSVGEHASSVNLENGEVTIKGAGDFEILLRLLPNVNISWYDSDEYTYTSGNLYAKSSPSTPITGDALKALVDREVKSITITVNKMAVEAITSEELAKFAAMIPDLEYTGKTYDLHTVEGAKDIFDILTEKYGDLIEFKGYTGTEVDEYTLIIKLKDENSSYWVTKETETVKVNDPEFDGYDPSYEVRWIEVDGKWEVKYVNAAGEEYNGGDYKLTVAYKYYKVIDAYVSVDTVFDEDGNLIDTTNKFATDEDGNIIRYSFISGAYVEDPEGTFVAKYKLRADGTITEMPEQVDGRNVVDKENSVVTITRTKTSTDAYEIKWYITNSTLAAPTLNESIKLYYNGKEQSAVKVLNGFVSAYMEIVEGGYGTNADTYEAKIRITSNNYTWRAGTNVVEEDGVEYVIVEWYIEQATIDLSNVRWKFTDGTKNYANGEGMVYTRKNNAPVIYWAELDNLPEAVKGSITYSTNGYPGANAGTDAGLYRTTFEIKDPDKNFKEIITPDSLETTVSWHIQRRLLKVPAMESAQMIFDDEPHNLLEMLDLEEDWAEYFTITVMYAKNFISYDAFEGYIAHGAGAYRFVFAIKTGINTNPSNPCVAWLKKTATTAPTLPEIEEEQEEELVPEIVETVEAVEEAPVMLDIQETNIVAVEEPTVEAVESVAEAPVVAVETPNTAVKTVAQQVCDRIKELTYGAQIQLHSHRKFTV